jgi:hypothetical protein
LVTVLTDETIKPGQKRTMKYFVEEKEEDVDEEVVVRAARIKKEAVETRIRTEEARKVPGTQGDTLKVVQNLPGVGRASFGSGQLVVWGSSPKETRVNVDGVEIPALYHMGGLRSTVNSDLVKSSSVSCRLRVSTAMWRVIFSTPRPKCPPPQRPGCVSPSRGE